VKQMRNEKPLDILHIDEKQAEEIAALYDACGKDDLELLRKHVLSALKPAHAAEPLPEWLYFNTRAKTEKALFHTASPVFVAHIADAKDLAVGWIDSIDWKYYDIAKDVFIGLGAMKAGLPASQKKPPSHIAERAVKPSGEMRESMENNMSNCAVFGLQCRCGGTEFRIKGQPGDGHVPLYDPLFAECSRCGERIPVFDGARNGYDGVQGFCERTEELKGEALLACPGCSGNVFEVVLGFEQSVDPEEARESIREEKLDARVADLFTWFFGNAKCALCGRKFRFADFECA
jgi:hypothetical protein